MPKREFVWANVKFLDLAHAIDEEQIATQQEAFCGIAPELTDRWGRMLPEDSAETPKCRECRKETVGMTCANDKIDRAIRREDAKERG